MSILRHHLKRIEDIMPWGDAESGYYLHWFGLTDSYYWFSFGQNELLRYSDEFIEKYKMDKKFPYVDYQFARIYDDFYSLLDKILSPIPACVFSYIDTIEKFECLMKSFSSWRNNKWNGEDDQYDEIYLPAFEWINNRRLDFSYLVGAPDIYFFLCDDRVYIRWFSDYNDKDGIKMWKNLKGEYIIEYNTFANEAKQSFELFWNTMDERIEKIISNWTCNKILIDKELLLKSHNKAKRMYSMPFTVINVNGDWDMVENNIKMIL